MISWDIDVKIDGKIKWVKERAKTHDTDSEESMT